MPGPKADARQSPERDGQGAPLALARPVHPALDVDAALGAKPGVEIRNAASPSRGGGRCLGNNQQEQESCWRSA